MPFGNHSLKVGEEAPLLTLSSESETPRLQSLKGKYVVLNFWSASDPESRINNKRLADLTSTLPSSQIQFVSICTDNDPSLQMEIMNADGIPANIHSLSSSELMPEVMEEYQIQSGCRSFLINPFGNLQAISPSSELIKSVTV